MMYSWRAIVLAILFTVTIHGTKSEDDEAHVENADEDDDILKPGEVDPVPYVSPDIDPSVYLGEHFDSEEVFEKKWIKSSAKKDGVEAAIDRYDGTWSLEAALKSPLSGDSGLVLKDKAKHSAISSHLSKPFVFDDKAFIVQYEIIFQAGQECGGGYLKLLSQSKNLDLTKFNDKTPYTIMFGPDRCGSDSKLHFIFRHVNPNNKTIEEKHCKKLETKERAVFEEMFKDNRPHLFRLIIDPDNTFQISVDYKIVNHGNLLNDFTPAVNPPAEIEDVNDRRPDDWDEREKIADPTASKPDDWDESEPRQILDEYAAMPDGWLEDEPDMVPDPNAEKPDDWDDDMDGDWEAPLIENPSCKDAPGCGPWSKPMIDNPKHKGKWAAPLITNPNYKGKWKPRKIPNPDYFHDPQPFMMMPIGAVGIELWSMSSDIYFDNLLITSDLEIADSWAKDTYGLKIQKLDVNSANIFTRIVNYSNKNPWLYAVYVVVIGLPLVLIITFCCTGESKTPESSDPKKTDELQEDDEVEETDEVDDTNVEEDEEEERNSDNNVIDDLDTSPVDEDKAPRKRKARRE